MELKIKKSDPLFDMFKSFGTPEKSTSLDFYIKRFLSLHPYTGGYFVEDSKYVSSVQNVRDKHFHPSGDCLKCAKLLYWERDPEHVIDLQEVVNPGLQVIFKTGNALHAMIQAWIEAMGELEGYPTFIENEQRIFDEQWNIGGYIDSLIKFPGESFETVVEIKTISDYGFRALKEPKIEHKMQVATYLMEKDSPRGIVYYINKNTGERKEFDVAPMDMMPILMKWAAVSEAVYKGDPSGLVGLCRTGDKTWERCPAKAFCKRCS